MPVYEIKAKSMLRKQRRMDSWFISSYGMNLYRGCTHNCAYCDGRSEKYRVDGNFGCDVGVKVNAIDILKREMDPARKRKSFNNGFFLLGGGVGDSYQPVEKEYHLTRQALELALEFNHPVHLLTKSTLVKRDLDIIREINRKTRATVSFSFSSIDEEISRIFEPGLESPIERLKALHQFKAAGIPAGMFLMPVIPFITDKPEVMNRTLAGAKKAQADYVVFGGMTLKAGRQHDYFMNIIEEHYPDLLVEYSQIYHKDNQWGNASSDYYQSINQTFGWLASRYGLAKRIPPKIYSSLLKKKERVIIILEHLDYLTKLKNPTAPFGLAARSITKLKDDFTDYEFRLRTIKGVGSFIEKIVKEILQTGTSRYYNKMLYE